MLALDVLTTPPPPDTPLTTPLSDTPRTPEHQIYQKQEEQSHGFLSSVSPKFVCLSYLIQSLFDLFHNVVFVRIGYFSRFGRFEQFNWGSIFFVYSCIISINLFLIYAVLLFKSNDHDSDEDEFGVKDKNLFKQRYSIFIFAFQFCCEWWLIIVGFRFEALDNSRKWKLKSEPGRFVEDVLYKLGMQC